MLDMLNAPLFGGHEVNNLREEEGGERREAVEELGPKILIHFTLVIEPKPYFVPCKEVGCPPICEMDNVLALGTKAPKTLICITFCLCTS